ncbi:MAG: preprotein translocase subunit YajC [Kiloniellaceae bacterium]
MLISPAYAQAAAGGGGSGLVSLLPLVLIFVVFYFLLIRPQQKKMKAHKALVEAVRRGDKVVTGGGLLGTVSKVINDNEIQVELAEGVRVRVVRSTIQDVISKPEPAEKAETGKAKGAPAGAKAANDDGGQGQGLSGVLKMLGMGRKSDS